MSELKKWRVTGPDGFEFFTPPFDNEAEAMEDAFVASILTAPYVMRQAGYRAEPIEEPKMVTVRAEDVAAVTGAKPASFVEIEHAGIRLRAALESAK